MKQIIYLILGLILGAFIAVGVIKYFKIQLLSLKQKIVFLIVMGKYVGTMAVVVLAGLALEEPLIAYLMEPNVLCILNKNNFNNLNL